MKYFVILDDNLIAVCRNLLRINFISIKYMPYELANTIANIYYHFLFYSNLLQNISEKNPDDIDYLINEYTIYNSRVISLPIFVNILGEFSDKKEYENAVEYIVDCLKYEMKNVNSKSIEERKIERYKKKHLINEIDNLVYILDI